MKNRGFTFRIKANDLQSRGFTLVELLVVISIVAIISAISVVSYQEIRQKTRDSIRKGDLQKISLALEGYFQKNSRYVPGSGNCSGSFYTDPDITSKFVGGNVPKDPSNGNYYCYVSTNTGASFRIFATLENPTDPDVISCPNSSYNYTKVSDDLTASCPP